MHHFNDKQIYIVTGASSGIGEATALMLNALGATVVAIARNEDRLNNLKSKCHRTENMHIEIKDLTENMENLPYYIKELKEKYGKFSGMAYCAGVANIIPLKVLSFDQLNYIFRVNYFAPIMMIKGFIDIKNNVGVGSSVVAISSLASRCCDKGHSAYAGSKSALCASLKSISKEVVLRGIRINCILPSNITTPMNNTEEYYESQKKNYPLGFGEPDDVAHLISYLLSDNARFISGQEYVIDTGLVI